MKTSINKRLDRLEKRVRPDTKIVVVWPGDPEPEASRNDYVIHVVYEDRPAS